MKARCVVCGGGGNWDETHLQKSLIGPEFGHDTACTPHVHSRSVGSLHQKDLGRSVPNRAHTGGQPRRRNIPQWLSRMIILDSISLMSLVLILDFLDSYPLCVRSRWITPSRNAPKSTTKSLTFHQASKTQEPASASWLCFYFCSNC